MVSQSLSLQRFVYGVIAAIIVIGIWARWTGLAWHFSHVDDIGVATTILDVRESGKNPFLAVSQYWTYSPFQYIFTPLLIDTHQNYREILFWGRLPSCVFSSLALVAMAYLLKRLYGAKTHLWLLPLAVFTFSWESIIFAKQMSNYALGLLGVVILLILLVNHVGRGSHISWRRMGLTGFALGLLSSFQYTIIFFIPAYYFITYFFDLVKSRKFFPVTIKYLFSVIVYGGVVYPLWYFFLSKWSDAGITDWSRGEGDVFYFSPDAAAGLWAKVQYVFDFYVQNWYAVFRSQIGFFPEDAFLFEPVMIGLMAFFMIGLAGFFIPALSVKKKEDRRIYFSCGCFFVGMLLTWSVLVALNKLPLSPTRHTLVLLPVFALCIGQGVAIVAQGPVRFVQRKELWQTSFMGAMAILVAAVFLWRYPAFLSERRDALDEREIAEVIEKYNVDFLFPVEWMAQVEHMNTVTRAFTSPINGIKRTAVMVRGPRPYNRIAWLSHRIALTPQTYKEAQSQINYYILDVNRRLKGLGLGQMPLLRAPYNQYKVIFEKEIISDVELEFSQQTKNGTNSLYFYILEKI